MVKGQRNNQSFAEGVTHYRRAQAVLLQDKRAAHDRGQSQGEVGGASWEGRFKYEQRRMGKRKVMCGKAKKSRIVDMAEAVGPIGKSHR